MIFSESIFTEKAQNVGSEMGGANESCADVVLRAGEYSTTGGPNLGSKR